MADEVYFDHLAIWGNQRLKREAVTAAEPKARPQKTLELNPAEADQEGQANGELFSERRGELEPTARRVRNVVLTFYPERAWAHSAQEKEREGSRSTPFSAREKGRPR